MGTEGSPRRSPTKPPDNSTVLLLLGDIVDTTWRMFLPTLGLGALGFWADLSWSTAPWLSITGVVVGSAVAGLLVKQQFGKINVK